MNNHIETSNPAIQELNPQGPVFTTFQDYFAYAKEQAEKEPESEQEAKMQEYVKLNVKRMQRMANQAEKLDMPEQALQQLEEPIDWLLITEPWCGDAAQSVPVIAKITELSDRINLHIILRDQNLEIMDRYLTNGSRSIPKLVAFDAEGNQLGEWGPRPQALTTFFQEQKAAGVEKPKIYEQLQLWYSRDRGKTIVQEFAQLIRQWGKQ